MVYPFATTLVAWVMQLRLLVWEGLSPSPIRLIDGGLMHYITPDAVQRHHDLFGLTYADKWVDWVEEHQGRLLYTFDKATPFPTDNDMFGNFEDDGGFGGVAGGAAAAAAGGVGGESVPEFVAATADQEPEPAAGPSSAPVRRGGGAAGGGDRRRR